LTTRRQSPSVSTGRYCSHQVQQWAGQRRQLCGLYPDHQPKGCVRSQSPLGNRTRLCDIEPIKLADLAIPDSAKQGVLELEEHAEIADLDQAEVEGEKASGEE
jgi:hypothetical protein